MSPDAPGHWNHPSPYAHWANAVLEPGSYPQSPDRALAELTGMNGGEGLGMGLRAFACRASLCVVLLVPGEARAREQVSSEVQDWLSAVITKIAEANGREAKPSRSKASLTVIVRVQIAADGFVNRVDVERSSGSPDLDERAKSVVRAASPFSPPPAPLLTKAGTTELSFPLRLGR